MLKAQRLFYNGILLTMDEQNPLAEAVAVSGERILAVGTYQQLAPYIDSQTEKIDLGGRTMIPGFNENHAHPVLHGMNLQQVNLDPACCPDIATMKKLLADKAFDVGPGVWIRGCSWDETRMSDGRIPNVDDISEVTPNNPVYLTRACLHMSLANYKALELAGVNQDTPDPDGGKYVRNQAGRLTGLLQENGQNAVRQQIPKMTVEDITEALALACQDFNSKGITTANECGTIIGVLFKDELTAWSRLRAQGRMTIRSAVFGFSRNNDPQQIYDVGILSGFGDTLLRFGPLKFLSDGSLGGATAYMKQAYLSDSQSHGIHYMEPAELEAKIKAAHDLGYQLSVHCIGDAAVDMVITAIEKAQAANPRPDCRHRLEHGSLCTPDLLGRVKKADICINMNPVFLYFFGMSHFKHIGEKVKYEFPAKSALAMDIPFSIGSDCPVLTPDPRYGLYGAVARRATDGQSLGEEERITVEQALYAFTAGGAYLNFEENEKGKIKKGMLADFAVLNFDPRCGNSEPKKLLELETEMTVLGGKIIYTK